jgi:hypothetical protein
MSTRPKKIGTTPPHPGDFTRTGDHAAISNKGLAYSAAPTMRR